MGYMISCNNSSFESAMNNISMYFPYTKQYEEYFISLGYSKCSGSGAYEAEIKSWEVQPFTRKFWRQTAKPNYIIQERIFTAYEVKEFDAVKQ